ncbi:MAG: aminotransferase class I/II-fold pyridoxal phosphate-dependent enzyme, partial [Methylotenera sp.]
MNPNMNLLQPYPFQRLNTLFADITPNSKYTPVNLSIGEPKHKTPEIIQASFIKHINGLAHYPTTKGSLGLRQAIADWATKRYNIPMLDVEKQVIPVNGSREALFAIAQAVIDKTKPSPVVISPNPFYQIYEGAALLAGAGPYFINTLSENDFKMDFSEVPSAILNRTQLVYVC